MDVHALQVLDQSQFTLIVDITTLDIAYLDNHAKVKPLMCAGQAKFLRVKTMPLATSTDLNAMRACAEEASCLLKTLGNAQRLRVLCLLVDREMSVGQINEQLPDLRQSALSQHLAKLREQGLVHTRREAQTIWYTIEPGPAEQIIDALYGIYCVVEKKAHPRKSRT